MKRIALFVHHPECSEECCDGVERALSDYVIERFTEENTFSALESADMVIFPGGIGDAASFDYFFRRKAQNAVADFVASGKKYLGICMGAYWAGPHYFDIVDSIDAVQYIKREDAEIRRSYGTVAEVDWLGETENMFFYDGCALVGDETKFKTYARYKNGEPMAVIQGNVGLIGCHPESEEFWYDEPYQYIKSHWHEGRHHALLKNFVDELMGRSNIGLVR